MPALRSADESRSRAQHYRRARARLPDMGEMLIRLVGRYEDLAQYLEERATAGKAKREARR